MDLLGRFFTSRHLGFLAILPILLVPACVAICISCMLKTITSWQDTKFVAILCYVLFKFGNSSSIKGQYWHLDFLYKVLSFEILHLSLMINIIGAWLVINSWRRTLTPRFHRFTSWFKINDLLEQHKPHTIVNFKNESQIIPQYVSESLKCPNCIHKVQRGLVFLFGQLLGTGDSPVYDTCPSCLTSFLVAPNNNFWAARLLLSALDQSGGWFSTLTLCLTLFALCSLLPADGPDFSQPLDLNINLACADTCTVALQKVLFPDSCWHDSVWIW